MLAGSLHWYRRSQHRGRVLYAAGPLGIQAAEYRAVNERPGRLLLHRGCGAEVPGIRRSADANSIPAGKSNTCTSAQYL